MADNIVIKDGNDVLATVATEDISGREFQLLKMGYGNPGTFTQITSSTPLPVEFLNQNVVSAISITNFPEITSAYIVNQTVPVIEVSSVSVNNFPSIQEVSGSLNVTNFPLVTSAYILNQVNPEIEVSAVTVTNVVEVSGTVNVGNSVSAVSITNFPETQNSNIVNSLSISSIPSITISNQVSSVSVENFPLTTSAYILNQTPVVSSVNVLNFPTTTSAFIINQTSSTSVSAVSITNFPSVQGVSGTISTGLVQGLTNTELRTSALNVSVGNSLSISSIPAITVSNFPAITSAFIINQTSAVNVLNFPTTQNISGTISATILNPTSSAVSVTNFPTNQTVDGVVGISGIPSVSVSNSVDISSIPPIIISNPVSSVSVTNFPTITSAYILNDSEISAVSITNFPTTQNIFGSVDVSSSVNIPTTPEGTLVNYWPAMQQIPTDVAGMNFDPSGALQVRGAITSDEGSYSTDFPGNTPYQILSGTCIFVNGSSLVSGIGTSFLSQLSYGDCVRLSADSNLYFTRVVSINSDTSLTLEYGYMGAGGSGGTYYFGFEQIKEGNSNISVLNSNVVLDSGTSANSLVQLSRVVDFLPTAAVLRGFSFNQNIPQVDPFFGFFDSDDIRNSNVACFVQFLTFQTAQLVTRTSLATYDTNIVQFNLPGNATVNIPARWRLEVTDDKVSVYYNEASVAISYNHLPPIYKSLNFNIGILNISVPPTNTILYCDEVLFKNVDVVNTASSLLTHVQASYDSNAGALLSELTSTINSLQATLKSFASIAGLSVNTLGQQRISVDNIAGSLTLGTITTVSTVTTVTGVTTVSTLSNQTNIGGYAANDMVPAQINNNALVLRQTGVVVS